MEKYIQSVLNKKSDFQRIIQWSNNMGKNAAYHNQYFKQYVQFLQKI